MVERRAVLIAGPTASGKTQAAIAAAQRLGARIVNTDSMQVYAGLRVITARPDAAELAAAPHFLFGHVDPATRYSTGAWLADAGKQIQEAEAQNQPLVFVGGTGLYFDALTNGFSPIPPVPQTLIQETEAEIAGLEEAGRRALLARLDPALARTLGAADPQRVVRAVSVFRATGVPLSQLQARNTAPLLAGYALEKTVLMPERAHLRRRIAERFEAMMARGASDEVAALLARDLDPSLPAMKAIGVRELAAYRAGAMTREEAVFKSVTASRQYAKRQTTWFRNRMADWRFVDPFA